MGGAIVTDIKVRVHESGKLHGFASCKVAGLVELRDMKIMDGKNGLWVAPASKERKGEAGKYDDLYRFTEEGQKVIGGAIIEVYEALGRGE